MKKQIIVIFLISLIFTGCCSSLRLFHPNSMDDSAANTSSGSEGEFETEEETEESSIETQEELVVLDHDLSFGGSQTVISVTQFPASAAYCTVEAGSGSVTEKRLHLTEGETEFTYRPEKPELFTADSILLVFYDEYQRKVTDKKILVFYDEERKAYTLSKIGSYV